MSEPSKGPVVANISEITSHYTSQGELEKLSEAIYAQCPEGGANNESPDWINVPS